MAANLVKNGYKSKLLALMDMLGEGELRFENEDGEWFEMEDMEGGMKDKDWEKLIRFENDIDRVMEDMKVEFSKRLDKLLEDYSQ
jgi:hypothetical protein